MTASLVSGPPPCLGSGVLSAAFADSTSLPPGSVTTRRIGTVPTAASIDCFTAASPTGEAASWPRNTPGVAASMSRLVFSRRSANRSGVR